MNDPRQANLEKFLGYLESDPDNYALICDAGDLAIEMGDIERARPLVHKAIALAPSDPVASYRMAVLLFLEKKFEESLALTGKILEGGEQHSAVLHRHALSLVQLGRFDEAAPLFARLTSEDQIFPDVPHQYIRALHYTGDLQQATDFARAHLENNSNDAFTRGMLSLLYIDQEDFKQAEIFAAETLATDANNMDALVAGGTAALAFEDEASAKLLFEKAVEVGPNSGRAWLGLGLTSMLQNDMTSAKQQFEKTIDCMPEHLGSWNTLAWLHILNRDFDAAQITLERANEVDHNFSETHGGLAVIAAMRGEWDKARTLSETALRLDKESFSGRFAQSLLIAHRGRPDSADKIMNNILENMTVPGGGTLNDLIRRHALKTSHGPSNRTLH